MRMSRVYRTYRTTMSSRGRTSPLGRSMRARSAPWAGMEGLTLGSSRPSVVGLVQFQPQRPRSSEQRVLRVPAQDRLGGRTPARRAEVVSARHLHDVAAHHRARIAVVVVPCVRFIRTTLPSTNCRGAAIKMPEHSGRASPARRRVRPTWKSLLQSCSYRSSSGSSRWRPPTAPRSTTDRGVRGPRTSSLRSAPAVATPALRAPRPTRRRTTAP